MRHARVGAVGENLVALQLGVLLVRRVDDRPALGVDRPGQLLGLRERVAEELAEHLDHVVERVLLVVQDDDVVGRLPAGGCVRSVLVLGAVRVVTIGSATAVSHRRAALIGRLPDRD